jgi:hypothetical protein
MIERVAVRAAASRVLVSADASVSKLSRTGDRLTSTLLHLFRFWRH